MDGAARVYRSWPRKLAAFVTLLYWWPAVGLDLLSLLRWGFSEDSAQRTVRMLLVESIAYLAVWSLFSAVVGIMNAEPAEIPRRKPRRDGAGGMRATRGR
jgi:hypothetical protein